MADKALPSGGSSRRSWRSHLSGSFRESFPDTTDVFHSKTGDEREGEEAALISAALLRLSGSARELEPRRSPQDLERASVGGRPHNEEIRIATGVEELESNERLLRGLREWMDRKGIQVPEIHVRFENLSVEADSYAGERALPTLFNSAVNVLEGVAALLGIPVSSKTTVNRILTRVSGVLRPSRMTLLLGPPGSGKSTLLLALAGKLRKSLRVTGSITYCGHELEEFVPQRTSAYVGQDDLHLGEMTVKEILDFSKRCLGLGPGGKELSEMAAAEKQAGVHPEPEIGALASGERDPNKLPAHILKMLGLDVCGDVLVGDEMRRGISGGQKKRVTLGEMLVGPARVLLLDEISNGLDSSTTFRIIKFLQQTVHALDATTLVSLVQPQPETFELFDDIILLSEGKIVYRGPRDKVIDFFEFAGFKCPERKGIPDFLQEVTSKKDQEQYWSDRQRPYRYIPVDDFVQAFNSFRGDADAAAEAAPFDKSKTHPWALVKDKYGFVPTWELFKACFAREWLLMKRNSPLYIVKTCQLIFLAALGASVFPRTEMRRETIADAGKFLGALFFGLSAVMFNGMAEIILTVIRLPVHYKQRDLLFYPAWAFGLPIVLIKIPLSLLESVIWVAVTYYATGFAPSVSRFFRQTLVFFWTHLAATSLFRFLASAGRSMVAANSGGVLYMVIIFALSGFVISKDDLDPWWIWGYWTSPAMYGINALAINEFLDSRWAQPNNDPNIDAATIGEALLKSRGMLVDGFWYWICVGALIILTLIYNLGFIACSTYLNSLEESRAVIIGEEGQLKPRGSQALQSSQGFADESGSLQSLRVSTSEAVPADFTSNGSSYRSDNSKKSLVLPFLPLSLSFSHVNYYVDMPLEMQHKGVEESRLQLLCDVSGAFRPGVLTALVGVSGAGKTTLMDVLAGRKTGGHIEGNISISGYPKNQSTFARVSGYCEQNDIHSPNVTVYESLIYSAWLRLPSDVELKKRKMFVEEVMELIELDKLRDSLVGLPGVNGLSTEQRKRFTVAVELVANPSIIFMDEPTSGLDARSAAIVMRTVRNTVNIGRTVVCTIHQPSIDIFESFDELLLMKLGGQVIYAGPLGQNSCNLIEYFHAIPGIPKMKPGHNPATWMLQITTPSVEIELDIDFAEVYRKSSLYQHNQTIIEELATLPVDSKDLFFDKPYATSFVTQFCACFWKQYWSYWRNPSYNGIRFLVTILVGLLFGTIFWNKGNHTDTQQNVLNFMGVVYCSSFFLGFLIGASVQPIVAIERTVFYRERAAGMYSALAYAFAQVAIECIYIAGQALLYCLICYPMIGFTWEIKKFLWYTFLEFMCFLYFGTHGMMSIAITPTYPIGNIVMLLFFSFWNIFCGFLIFRPMMPKWWRWCYWTSPVAWTIYGLVVSQLGEIEEIIQIPGNPSMPVKEFLKEVLGYDHGFLGYVALAHVSFVLLFSLVFTLGIKFLNFQRR